MRFTLFIFALLVARNAGATDPSLAALCREHYRLVGNATVPDRDGQPSSTQRANEWVGRFVKLVNAEAAATAPALASANRFGGMPFRADPAGGGHVLDFATGGQTGTPPPNYYPALKERLAFLEWKLTYEYTSVEASVVTDPAEIRRLLESPGYRVSQRQLGRRGFVGLIAGAVVGAVAGAARTTSSILHERQAILDETVAGMKKKPRRFA